VVARGRPILSRLTGALVFLALTLLTQVGGVVLVVVWAVARSNTLPRWRRLGLNALMLAGLYAAFSFFLVPPLAALGGRVPLACFGDGEHPFAAASPAYCALNRNYVDPRLASLLAELSRAMVRAFSGTTTLYLDANFPFLNGFPLLPHLSHDDGRKLDIAYYYADAAGTYLPGKLRSPIGYWGFEQPGPNDVPTPCPDSLLSLRWNMTALQGLWPARELEPDRTRAALHWLVTEGPKFGVGRIFIEPYLAARLGVASPVLGFQGCRAARHDDHIHIQLNP
jgi:hypothetical protein